MKRQLPRIAIGAWVLATLAMFIVLPAPWLTVGLEEGWLISSLELSGDQLVPTGFPLLTGTSLSFVLALIFSGSPRFFALIATISQAATALLISILLLSPVDDFSAVPLEVVRVLRAPLEAATGLSDIMAIADTLESFSWGPLGALAVALCLLGALGSLWFLIRPRDFSSAMGRRNGTRPETSVEQSDSDPISLWDEQERGNSKG